uniref:Secreted protein n=1 Tax=Rhabditophanes sp. KR3021 TaxID=114890 RepID=A0AC35UDH3_9BILA
MHSLVLLVLVFSFSSVFSKAVVESTSLTFVTNINYDPMGDNEPLAASLHDKLCARLSEMDSAKDEMIVKQNLDFDLNGKIAIIMSVSQEVVSCDDVIKTAFILVKQMKNVKSIITRCGKKTPLTISA